MTDAFDVYTMYLALKQHFTSDYDYFKYNGRIKANKESFLRRKDRFAFHKIAKQQKDPLKFLLANFVANTNFYPSDVAKAEEVYVKWRATQERLTYQFKNDLEKFQSPFFDNFKTDGQHPVALKLVMQDKIDINTIVIVNSIFRGEVVQYWDSAIQDPVLYPMLSKIIKNYEPFLNVDKKKFFDILVDFFPEISDK